MGRFESYQECQTAPWEPTEAQERTRNVRRDYPSSQHHREQYISHWYVGASIELCGLLIFDILA